MATTMEQLATRLKDKEGDIEGNRVLERLIAALDGSEPAFDTRELYHLNSNDFDLALTLLKDWKFRSHIHAEEGLRAKISSLMTAHEHFLHGW